MVWTMWKRFDDGNFLIFFWGNTYTKQAPSSNAGIPNNFIILINQTLNPSSQSNLAQEQNIFASVLDGRID